MKSKTKNEQHRANPTGILQDEDSLDILVAACYLYYWNFYSGCVELFFLFLGSGQPWDSKIAEQHCSFYMPYFLIYHSFPCNADSSDHFQTNGTLFCG